MRKMALVVLFCLVCVLSEYSQAFAQASGSQNDISPAGPEVMAQPQLGSPLRISSTKTQWLAPDRQSFEIYIVVENVSDKSIRAYATYNADASKAQESKRCFLYNVPSNGKVLQPGQKDGKSVWRHLSDTTSQPNIELVVDFVEFTDGSVWGIDTCQSMQGLEGWRAGALASKRQLKRILLEKGPEGVLAELKNRSSVDWPQGRSAPWIEGFRGGVSSIRERVGRAFEQGGLPEINTDLQRPFDASENP